ncbi:MAG: hypothetical protein HYY34_03210 [Chloroflexi bacterium]|nr:hypothetical protein [Chloroflexota bacterium]
MKEHRANKEQGKVDHQGWDPSDGVRVSFVMTLWLEPQGGKGQPEWRWRVCHVQTGDQAYFRRLTDVMAFISSQSRFPAPR